MAIVLTASKIVLDSDMAALMGAALNDRSAAAKKKRLMLMILANTGVRVSELAGIRIVDTPWALGVNLIEVNKGKRGNCRNIMITSELAGLIEDYIIHDRAKSLPRGTGKFKLTGWLFYNRKRKKYSRQAIAKMVLRTAKRAKIRNKITPHMLRHRFATVSLANGIDIWKVKSWMGHASLATTEKYLDVAYLFESQAEESLVHLSKALIAVN